MATGRHLILQKFTLQPAGEWMPPASGWTVARIVEGVGYWWQRGEVREFQAGDGFVTSLNSQFVLRASQLGPLTVEYFCVQPHYLNGVLTVTEAHQITDASKANFRLVLFTATEPLGRKFTDLAGQAQGESLPVRTALLQLWAQAVGGAFAQPVNDRQGQGLKERFRRLVAQMPDVELATRPLTDLAKQLHCSERHFTRLFREEFGLPLRALQTELRLQRAQQLLADPDAKIINVAYDSGYQHLGLFNTMFKKHFGLTPGQWRRKNVSAPAKRPAKRGSVVLALLLALVQCLQASAVAADVTNAPPATNASPHFTVQKYFVTGNSVLPPNKIAQILTNTPGVFGTNVTFPDIRTALGELQMAYRERGFVTVSVGLPPQKLTNETVNIKVTEGRLAAINVKGNEYYSTENVLRALPSLHTNMLLNSHVFQSELDVANANRNRQIYPVISPGPEPGTTDLTLKVKDRLPLHGRIEVNNESTPGTPDQRINLNAQYDNLWQLEHQIGFQYTFAPVDFSSDRVYSQSFLDSPPVASYSAFYRLPLSGKTSAQHQLDASPGSFGYNEITHQFQMPAPTGQPDLTFYASRSVDDTGVQLGPLINVVSTPLITIDRQDSGQNITLNEGLGFKVALPLPTIGKLATTLSFGADYKLFDQTSFNTNLFYATTVVTNSSGVQEITQTVASPQPPRYSSVEYFPLNVRLGGSLPDASGTTTFYVQANANIHTHGELSSVAYTTNAANNYCTVQLGLNREQKVYQDWTVLLHADGQWANGPLFSNEQFAMGGVAGVRGFANGVAYGDQGWRATIEPRTPMMNIGMVDGTVPFWLRGSVFLDYGQVNWAEASPGIPHTPGTLDFMGAGFGVTANIGSHLDARLSVAWPLHDPFPKNTTPGGDHWQFYFSVGAQF